MSGRRLPRPLAGALLLALLPAVAGCGEDAGADGGATAPAPTGRPTSPPAGGATTDASAEVRVGIAEWDIVAASTTVPVGEVVLQVLNTGGTEHELVVRTPYGRWSTGSLAPGEGADLEVLARPGARLRLTCGESGHPAHGDPLVLRVRG